MHTIPAYTPRVTLFTNDGQTRKFESHKAALEELGLNWIARNVGEHFSQFDGFDVLHTESGITKTPRYRQAYAIMRTDLGDVLTAADFRSLVKKHYPMWRYGRYLYWNGEGPVPWTGKRSGGRWLRRIGTTQERRMAQSLDPDEPAPRAARNEKNLPNSWDDYSIAAREDINWKRHRKTQWKAPRD